MITFADDIIEAAQGESIESIVIGEFGWGGPNPYAKSRVTEHVEPIHDKILSWEQAKPMLDFSYSSGYGAPECYAITAWTKSYVLFVTQYDGSTNVCRVPRNPIDHKPNMPGG
jgi:hypothetical protein